MKKHNKLISIAMAALLVCLLIAGCGKQNTPANMPEGTQAPSSIIQTEATAANEQELRELLARDAELVIHTSGEMAVREGFTVNGTKTLTGDVKLTMALGAELGQSLLSVSEGSCLTLNGPVLDCNYNSDGIFVAEKAELTALSGAIKYAGAYGILTYGNVTIEDIRIEDCEFVSICAQTGSRVDVKGGSILRSASNDIFVVNGASVNISGNTVMEGALEHGMINYGTLEINGGKFGNVNNYLCDNYGDLKVAYKGDDANGAIEFYGARNSVFLIRKASTASIEDVYIHDTQRQGIASLGGETAIANCKIENTGTHSIDIQGGKASVENVVISGSLGSGMEASNGSEVTVKNFTVNSCEKIGIASRGAKVTGSNIHISNTGKYGLTCGDTKTGHGVLKVNGAVITKAGAHGIYVYEKARAELENVAVSGGESRGIYVAATASCTVGGESSFKQNAKGGVEVRGTLRLDDVVVSDNRTQNSGAGVYVADGGSVTINNGVICNNSSGLRGGGICVSKATLTVNGCKIYNNSAVNHGGGLYAQNGAVVTLRTGSLNNNKSAYYGNGIYILSKETNVTVSGAFYLGKNDVKVDNVETHLTITRDSMTRHSASDPVLLTPNYNAAEGTVIATCKSAAAAKAVLAAAAPGDGSYELAQDGNNIVIKYAVADMDMTGADTVEVSGFAELKAAIEGANTKRNIVLKSDILFTERIRFPGGVTVNIQDDGTKRTLSRAEGFTDSFFVTHYGTGLYLTGTASEMLVLDGGADKAAEGTKLQSLVRAAGSTEIKNVVLRNNGSLLKEHDVRGALVRQLYGDIKLYDCVLSDGSAYSGGALQLDQGKGYAENCVFTNNESTIGGGAIRISAGCEMEVASSRILSNHAGSTGGGIVAVGASKVTATNTTFEDNTAVSYGGAVGAQDAETRIILIGSEDAALFKNNSSATAGAVYAVTGVQTEISGYTFEGNTATDGRSGAITVLDHSTAVIRDTTFYGNKASASAGALSVDGSKAQLINCVFGKEGAGNEAGDKAGAIVVMNGGTVEMTVEDGKTGSVSHNSAVGVAGAIYVEKDSTLKAEHYLFEGNQGSSGGAIYIVDGAAAECVNNEFTKNKAITGSTYGNGGAVYCAGTFKDTGSSYYENAAKNGGAVIVMGTGTAQLDGTAAKAEMKGNTATNNGGAVFVNSDGKAAVTGYMLEGNVSSKAGGIQVQVRANAELNDLSFAGDGNGVYVNGNVTFDNLTGVRLVKTNANAKFVVGGYQNGNVIEFTPKDYKSEVVLTKAEGMSDSEFQKACDGIAVTPKDGQYWFICNVDNAGKLMSTAVSATTAGKTEYFDTLAEAVAYANGKDTPVEIVVLANTTVSEAIEVAKNVTIVNAAGREIKISRESSFTGDLFTVSGTLTLGSKDSGKLIVDAASASNIDGRTVTVACGATFTLEKNAVLQNAKSKKTGAAVYTESENTVLYGTIQNNVSAKAGAALDVAKNAKAEINGASFVGNRAAGAGGAIRVLADAEVTCGNARFESNKALSGSTYYNGGAVYVEGVFTDTNSSYVGNMGKNGGAIIVMNGGNATLTGTDGAKAVFTNNQATGDKNSRGGAIFVNGGGSASVTGYTLEGNISNGTNANTAGGAVHVIGTAALNDLVFKGTAEQKIYVEKTLTFGNLTGAHIVQAKAAGSQTVSGYQAGNVIEFTPFAYEAKTVLAKDEAMSDEDFKAACKAIAVTQKGDGSHWSIDETGKLTAAVAGITSGNTTEYFYTLSDALSKAQGTTEILILENVTLAETAMISDTITLRSLPGKTVTISRAADFTGDLFHVTGSLTLGSTDSGKLVVDAASASAIAGRTVTVASGAAFTLQKNATLQNANSKSAGAAIQTAGKTFVYGTLYSNTVTGTTLGGAGIYALSGAEITIDGATFRDNKCVVSGSSAGAGAALNIQSGATVACQNAVFENNTVPTTKNGGAIYCAGTYTDTNSSYIGNQAKNGGAIFAPKGGDVSITGTDAAKAVFRNNTASVNGGAIFANEATSRVSVTGYTFDSNSGGSEIQVVPTAEGCGVTLKNVVFQGTATRKVYVSGNLTFENLTDAHIVQAKASANLTVTGAQAGTGIQLTPAGYSDGTVILKGTNADFSGVAVTQTDDGKYWIIDKDGKLTSVAASISTGGAAAYFGTLEAAVAQGNDGAQIEVLVNTTVNATIGVSKNVTIRPAAGKTVTISRGEGFDGDLFNVSAGSLTLGSTDSGTLIVDGASASAIAGRTVTVASGAAFTLQKNATLKNANSTNAGAAIQTASSATYVYGTIHNNTVTGTNIGGAGIYALAGAQVNIDGATFSENKCVASGSSAGAGAALNILKGAKVICKNAVFKDNVVPHSGSLLKNGGAIYCAGSFEDTNSTFTGSKAKNGGAIFIPSGGSVTLTGTDATKALFKDNSAAGASGSKGGAIYVNGGTLTVDGYTFTNNTSTTTTQESDSRNPAIWRASGTATVTNVTFSE